MCRKVFFNKPTVLPYYQRALRAALGRGVGTAGRSERGFLLFVYTAGTPSRVRIAVLIALILCAGVIGMKLRLVGLLLAVGAGGPTTDRAVYPDKYHEFKAPSHLKERSWVSLRVARLPGLRADERGYTVGTANSLFLVAIFQCFTGIALGAVCLFLPKRMRDYEVQLVTKHFPQSPFLNWMKAEKYLWFLRLLGIAVSGLGALCAFLVLRRFWDIVFN